MSEIPLNKFEKEKRVIELHTQWKTIRDIAKEVHMSFKDIGRIIKAYERKIRLQAKREESNQSNLTKKPSISTQAFKLFRDGKKLIDVVIDLELSYEQADKLFSQYLKLERMYEAYEFYNDYEHDIPGFLSIRNFIKNNHVYTNKIAGIMKQAQDIISLQSQLSILKREIEELKQIKNNLQYYKDIHALKSISEINWNYPKYRI
jgi:DNA-binding Lrp family transcriptional regulator